MIKTLLYQYENLAVELKRNTKNFQAKMEELNEERKNREWAKGNYLQYLDAQWDDLWDKEYEAEGF